MSERIAALARRVRGDPFFLAAVLDAYARSEGLDEVGLAALLACPVATLAPLGLCRRPRPEPPLFRRDVERIAARFGVRADALAEVVRRADALAALRRIAAGDAADADERGLLMAARDREEDGAEEQEQPDEPGEEPS